MKKTVPFLLLMLLSNVAYSQQYKRFRLTAGVGLLPLTFIEPSFRINDQFSVGVKYESSSSDAYYIGVEDRSSWAITSQCYLIKEESIRPFVGLGIGYYHFGQLLSPVSDMCDIMYNKSQIGFFPRIGFDTRRLTVVLDFNLIGSISYLQRCRFQAPTERSTTKNYLTVKAGFTIGSGKKKSEAGNVFEPLKKLFNRK